MSGDRRHDPSGRRARLGEAVLPILVLIGLIVVNLVYFDGDPQIPLILASVVAAGIGWRLGWSWDSIQQGIVDGITIALGPILILMAIGILIGTWIAAGIVPILIYYGLELLTPGLFLVAACLICAVVSVSTGSSWTTAATIGIALMGIGEGLNVPLPMVAGAVVSGAYFGDKLSPLSDTTNLAPAAAGADLFEHIAYMLYTTLPALVVALILYGGLGVFVVDGEADTGKVTEIQTALREGFHLHPVLLLPPLLVVIMVIFRIPPLPALLGGGVLGGLFAGIVQDESIAAIFSIAHYGYASETGVSAVDELLTGGGLDSMMYTISLILCALAFGGILEKTGMLAAIAEALLRRARSVGGLIGTTVASCVTMNVVAPDQYLAIIVPGRMYRNAYRDRGLHPKVLSRTLEDAGTLTSPLVPWNSCGAYIGAALKMDPFLYLPFAFLNLLSPLLAVVYGFTGWTIVRANSSETEIPHPAFKDREKPNDH